MDWIRGSKRWELFSKLEKNSMALETWWFGHTLT
jgi:hypothetical protein